MKGLVILGAGHHGRVCKLLAEECGYNPYAFVDEGLNGTIDGIPVYHSIQEIEDFRDYYYFIAIGKIPGRKKFAEELDRLGLQSVNLIDKGAYIYPHTDIGTGNYIGKFSIIYPYSKIGNHNLINCKVIISQETKVGSNNNISLGCNICAGSEIGDDCYIGLQASTDTWVKVGDGAVIGAGAIVLHDVGAGEFVAGVPAVKKERRSK